MKEFGEKILGMFHANAITDSLSLKVVLLLATGFALSSILGYFALRMKVSPILGYLLAGYLIGPHSPGFVADMQTSQQLAEIGVILMMFGVGLNFRLQDLIKVKNIVIPGAVGQILISALLTIGVTHLFGWPLMMGLILGLSIGVSSTVVLFRMLEEKKLLHTQEGRISVGWLIVEDIITVIILLFLPSLSNIFNNNEFSIYEILKTASIVLIKFIVVIVFLLKFSQKTVGYIFSKILRARSHELFTLSILALVFLIAMATTLFCGISVALGAFLAGMVIRQTRIRHKALLHSIPIKDAFIAIFFLSVGMLFNPNVIENNFSFFISILLIILIAKPIIAFLISIALKYPFKIALTIAVALTQIGEFSFILSEEAMKFGFMSKEGYDVIVACALISIAVNPLFFKLLKSKKKEP